VSTTSLMNVDTEPRYAEATRRMGNLSAGAAGGLTLLTLVALWGQWSAMVLVAAGQVVLIAFNLWVNKVGLRRLGTRRGEVLRTVVNTTATLALVHLTDWPFPAWFWLPFIALAYEHLGSRTAWVVLVVFSVTFNGLAFVDGQPPLYALSFTMLAIFCAVVSKVRFDIMRAMVLESDRRSGDLAGAHSATHDALARLKEEVRAREEVEVELRHAQKLQAVGRLAAGIAHEINTPIQFVGDSVQFMREATRDLLALVEVYRKRATDEEIAEAEDQADLEYLVTELPAASDRATDGLRRVASIVRSMKMFAHPDAKSMSRVNLNDVVESALAIASTEYKHVAEVETYLAPLPPISCNAGEIGQVILNLVVNAAHAVAERGHRGCIVVVTRREGDQVVLSVADDGGGIPESIRAHIFEPFFTTKEIGRGTGQGLAITRSVVSRHGGSLTFESTVGLGTTFFVRLPLEEASGATAA
jgi:signal transduction histidine kinase